MSLLRSRAVRQAIPSEAVSTLLDALPATLLTAADERALGRRVQLGLAAQRQLARRRRAPPRVQRRLAHQVDDGQQARDALIMANLRLVFYAAQRYPAEAAEIGDLIQDGIVGLIRAAEKFDPRYGVRFATYAAYWLRKTIGESVRASWEASVPLPIAPRSSTSSPTTLTLISPGLRLARLFSMDAEERRRGFDY